VVIAVDVVDVGNVPDEEGVIPSACWPEPEDVVVVVVVGSDGLDGLGAGVCCWGCGLDAGPFGLPVGATAGAPGVVDGSSGEDGGMTPRSLVHIGVSRS